MPIELDTPATRPEIAAKTFPFMWLYNVIIHAPGPMHPAAVRVEAVPMAADGELLPSGTQVIASDEFMLAVAEVPEVRAAYDATLASVRPMQAWIAEREEIKRREREKQQGGE